MKGLGTGNWELRGADCGTWSECDSDYSGRDLNDQRRMKDEVRWAGPAWQSQRGSDEERTAGQG